MKITVTGGAGFIGTNVCLEAVRRGHQVTAFDSFIRNKTEENIPILQKAGVKIVRGDVRNRTDLERLPVPDAVIHFAANPGIPWSLEFPTYDFDVNVGGTINVLEYVRFLQEDLEKKIPFIFASTNKVYSDYINEIPLTETPNRYTWRQPRGGWIDGVSLAGISEGFPIDGFGLYPHSPYGVSKLSGDQYCQEYFHLYGVPTVINRMSCIYGFFQKGVADQGWIDHFIREIGFGKGKLDIFGDGKQVRDMLWGGDVARLYLDEVEQIDKVEGKVFNIGGGKDNTMSLIEAIAEIEKVSGKTAELKSHPWRHADQKVYISDITRIKSILGWEPTVTPKEGIALMYGRYQQEL